VIPARPKSFPTPRHHMPAAMSVARIARGSRVREVHGHSMGGVISHTLVSSSQSRVWASVFRVPPAELKGDPESVRELVHVLYFRRTSQQVVEVVSHPGGQLTDHSELLAMRSLRPAEVISSNGQKGILKSGPTAYRLLKAI
jgi:hypothetical protein